MLIVISFCHDPKVPGQMWANIGARKIPAFIRVKMWLGLEAESENFQRGLKDAEVAVFAETVSKKNCCSFPVSY